MMKKRFVLFVVFILGSVLLFGDHTIELPGVLKPHLFDVEGDNLFVVEETSVFIFSLTDFKLLSKFGRQGEGPGELKGYISAIEVEPDHIMINSMGRLSWFSRNGDFIKQQTDASLGHNHKILGNRYVGMKMILEKDGIYFSISILNLDLSVLKEILRYPHPFFQRNRKINPVDVRISSYCVYKQQVFVDKNGKIMVFDKDGNMLFEFTHEHEPVQITENDRKRYLDFWKSDLKAEYEVYKDRLEFPEYFPPIRDFQVADGRIYIVSYQEQEAKSRLFIYDVNGMLLKKIWAPLTGTSMILPHLFNYYRIKHNKLYILKENEDREIWELKTIKID